MTEPRRFPFGGVPVYNPQSLTKGEALAQFHARQAAYESLLDLLREERPSHVLIIGTRGMGKTTLLQRVRYGVEDAPELNGRYLALAFPEEQYNVNHLYHFLLNAVDALADAIERLGNERMVARVEAYAERAGKLTPEQLEEDVPKFLAEISRELQRSLLLLVDNADRLFETIEDREQWRLRELFSTRRDLTFFGATTQASDGIYGAKRAFFEFFKIQQLSPLTLEEVRTLLLRLSESVEENEAEKGAARRRVEEWLAADAARLRTLVQLTGGNPRTTVLLFHLVLDGLEGGAREYLEQLLDQCTPGYKGRIDELPSQAQQVLDAVALRWDPVTAMEVAADTRLETSAVSTQLTRLVRQGLLEKADPGDSKKAFYQVAERFFNIWYLMRASRRVRAKLRWFIEFLRVFFDSSELEKMAWERLEHFRRSRGPSPGEIENIFAYALASGKDRNKFDDYLRRECADREEAWRPLVELLGGPEEKDFKGRRRRNVESTEQEVDKRVVLEVEALRRAVEVNPNNAEDWRLLGSALAKERESLLEAEAAFRKAIELDPQYRRAWAHLGEFLRQMPDHEVEAEAAFRKAIEIDPHYAWDWAHLGALLRRIPNREAEAEAALRKAIGLDPKYRWPWALLGEILPQMPDRETAFRKAIELDPQYAWDWAHLGALLRRIPNREAEAEAALRKAIDLDPNYHFAWAQLGDFLCQMPNRRAEAEAALRKSLELDPTSVPSWASLGALLREMPNRLAEAEAAVRKVIEFEPSDAGAWASLGTLLWQTRDRKEEAEAAFRKAVDLDPTLALFWVSLGTLLWQTPNREEEAEATLRKAVELDPKFAPAWVSLGMLLCQTPNRAPEAEAAFVKALDIDPNDGNLWSLFGYFLACMAGKPGAAEGAFRKSVELRPQNCTTVRNLGVLLFCEPLDEEEGVWYIRRAHQLDPTDSVSAAIFAACVRGPQAEDEQLPLFMDASRQASFWGELLALCQNYAPFGKILLRICDLVEERDGSNTQAPLLRAVALAQLGDFPRASVALEDALVGDPIDLLSSGREALETFFAAAVKNERVRDCLDLLNKKEWKDAWRPIYEALMAVEAGSGEYLKRVAVEIRKPAQDILRRIAPELPGLSASTS